MPAAPARPVGRGAPQADPGRGPDGVALMRTDAPPAPAGHPRHRRRVAVRRPLRPPLVPPGPGVARLPGAGHRQPAPRVVEPAPRGRILDRNGVVLVDNRLSFVVSLDRQVLGELDDDERPSLLARLVARARHRRARHHRRGPRAAPGVRTASARTRRCRWPTTSPRTSPSTSPSTRPTSPARRRRAAGRAHLPVRHASPPTSSATSAPSTTRSSQAPARLAARATSSPTRSGRAASSAPTRRSCGARPGAGCSRSTPRAAPSSELDYDAAGRGPRLVPLHRRHRAGRRRAGARARSSSGPASREQRDGTVQAAPAGSAVVLDPNDGAVVAMASFPTYDPDDVHRRHRRREWAALNDPETATTRSSTGPSRASTPRARRSSSSPRTPASRPALITHRDHHRRRRLLPRPGLPAASAASSTTPGSRRYGTVDLRRGAHGVERRVLLRPRRPLLDRARARSATPSRTPPPLFGFGARHRHPAARRAQRLDPDAREHAAAPRGQPRGLPRRRVVHRRQRQPRHRPGRRARRRRSSSPTPTPPSPTAARSTQPNIAREVHDRRHRRGRARPSRPARSAPIEFQPGWREAIIDGLHRRHPGQRRHRRGHLRRVPQLDRRRQDRHGPGRRPGRHLALRRLRPRPRRRATSPPPCSRSPASAASAAAPLVRRILESMADPALTPTVTPDASNPAGFSLVDPAARRGRPNVSGDRGD